MFKTPNQWVKRAPFGRWDLRFATAPYPKRYKYSRASRKGVEI
jgi:hypothetical protein